MTNKTNSDEKILESESQEILVLKSEIEALKSENAELKANIEALSSPAEEKGVEIFKRSDWSDKLKEFLCAYPEARNYAKRISEILISEKDSAVRDDALHYAFIKALSMNKTPDELMEDEDFLNKHVYLSQKIRDKIIADYVAEIEKGAPSVIMKGGEVFLSPPKKPRTLDEAMRLAEKLLS